MAIRNSSRQPARWVRAEIRKWVAERIAERDGIRPDVNTDDIALIPLTAVCELSGLKKSSIYALIAAGKFPRQVSLDLGREAR